MISRSGSMGCSTPDVRRRHLALLHNTKRSQEAQSNLCAAISRLNSMANDQRKGRDDLNHAVIAAALDVVRKHKGDRDAELVLADSIFSSFEALRVCIAESASNIDRVDPQLCNNRELVHCLVDWEVSWETGNDYLCHPARLAALCSLVNNLKEAQDNQNFRSMCKDCDAELFLVLPRMIIHWFLSNPALHGEFLRPLLPHRFPVEGDADVQKLVISADCLCSRLPGVTKLDRLATARRLFHRRALGGPGCPTAADELPGVVLLPALAREIDDYVFAVERWSMELQRHSPDDWSRCCSVVLECLEEL